MPGPARHSPGATPRRARRAPRRASDAGHTCCAFAGTAALLPRSAKSANALQHTGARVARQKQRVTSAARRPVASSPSPPPLPLPQHHQEQQQVPAPEAPIVGRRRFCLSAVSAVVAGVAGLRRPEDAFAQNAGQAPATGFVTKSGLRYYDFVMGDGAKPKWGDFLTIEYAMYTISPKGDALVKADTTFDSDRSYFIHHGNGETILGLEEALHSMQAGGRRRVIIPPKMAYVSGRLGPIPLWARQRKKFFAKLDATGGTVVFDVELLQIEPYDDVNGYYSDETPSPQELGAMLKKIEKENIAKGI